MKTTILLPALLGLALSGCAANRPTVVPSGAGGGNVPSASRSGQPHLPRQIDDAAGAQR